MRIAIWWSELPGYAAACIRALSERDDVEVAAGRYVRSTNKPYAEEIQAVPVRCDLIDERESIQEQRITIERQVAEFEPDVLVVPGWAIDVFNQLARQRRRLGKIVVCMADNQWKGTIRQYLGSVYARVAFRRRYSAMFVPGERARVLANALGYSGRRVILGSYSADVEMFDGIKASNDRKLPNGDQGAFLFAGSVIKRKGVRELIEAYSRYRDSTVAPWRLIVAGEGPLVDEMAEVVGVDLVGFVQPDELAQLMAQVDVFVLPSWSEGWALVIHEAVAAGLPVLCSQQCGSNVELVRDSYNGFVCEAGDVELMSRLMARFTNMTLEQRRRMGKRSHGMAKQFTPQLWAQRLVEGVRSLPEWS